LSYDVIVVGCGIAGLSAAAAAFQGGARPVVLERSPKEERGGNTRYTEAFLRMKNEHEPSEDFETKLVENSGGYPDPELVAMTATPPAQWPPLVRALSINDPEVIAKFAASTGPAIQWLKTMGVRFDFLPTPFLTTSTTRMAPSGGGRALVEALCAYLEANDVPIHYDTAARALVRDAAGTVVGLRAVSRGNRPVEYAGGAVVLASGGFEGNPEMLAQYLGPRALYLRPVARGGHYNKGEGIRMALAAGAAPCGDFGSYHAEPIDPRSGMPEAANFVFPYGILVNKEGQRFVDEAAGTVDATYESVTRRIYNQTDGIAYSLFDAKLADVPNVRLGLRTDQPPIQADSIAALAAALEMRPDRLEATVSAYNAACGPGTFKALEADGLATRGLEPPKSNWARPLDKPPFQAYPIISANVFTFGGVKVNTDAQVINTDGDVIPGLYAAGEVVGMYYRTYPGSTSVLRGAVFGRLAGEHAAALRKGGA